VHTKNISLPDTQKNIPANWPLVDSKTTCLTCHAVLLQMQANPVQQRGNINFLRGYQSGDIVAFCFNCHQKERFQKTNPHQQTGSRGSANRSSCFLCHTEGLASGFEVCFEASVKMKGPSLCIGCHWNLPKGHIVHEQLESDTLSAKEAALYKLDEEGIELPLEDGRMHCATCHNPHPEGIIGRKEAAIGAGEKYFLRIPNTHDLCVVCHADESIEEYMQRFQQK
jgi:RNase P subunit RPR2